MRTEINCTGLYPVLERVYMMIPSSNSALRSAQESSDLWRSAFHGRSIDENSRITTHEMKSLVELAELGFQWTDELGLSSREDGFWRFLSWVRFLSDPDLATLSNVVGRIKKRLGRLIEKRDQGAINDHIWVSALAADCHDEIERRVRLAGSPVLGDGSRFDAHRTFGAMSTAHALWRKAASLESVKCNHGMTDHVIGTHLSLTPKRTDANAIETGGAAWL